MRVSLGTFEQHPFLLILLAAILIFVGVYSSYLASKRLGLNTLRFALVLSANITLAIAIIGLALDIQLPSSSQSKVYLATYGTTTEQLSNLGTKQTVYQLGDASHSLIDNEISAQVINIDSPTQLLPFESDMQVLHILGDGLSFEQWTDLRTVLGDSFEKLTLEFSPAEKRIGLIDMRWPKEWVEGQTGSISGKLQSSNTQDDTIYELNLIDPVGQLVESLRLKPTEQFTFDLAAKNQGQWRYRLQLKQANQNELIADEPVAFSVTAPPVIRMLIKQAAPSFETRQLKNWANEFGAKIVMLSKISKNKDIRQNVNLTQQEITQTAVPFNSLVLDTFDLILIDGRSLLTLSNENTQALIQAVNNGLGLYVWADKDLVDAWPSFSLNGLFGVDLQPLNEATYSAIPQWQHSHIEQAIPLMKATLSLQPLSQSEALVTSHSGQPLVSSKPLGMGQVAISLINSSYGWQTAGLTAEYSHYWQSMLHKTSRTMRRPYWLEAAQNDIQHTKQRQQKCVIGSIDTIEARHTYAGNAQSLTMATDIIQADKHCATVWLATQGWHRLSWSDKLKENNKIETNIYAYQSTDWQVWQQAKNTLATLSAVQQNTNPSLTKSRFNPLDKQWFWWCLLLSACILWIERKLFS